jgi:uncharacterized NAD(P)/FAD-binding protein YdhS/uncharacterized RmlC-like cupin family protein
MEENLANDLNNYTQINLNDLKNFSHFKYARNLIVKSKNFESLLLCLLPGQGTVRHNHGNSDCMTMVLSGEITCRNYYPDGAETSATLRAGDIEFLPAGLEHEISNKSDEKYISINIYSPPLEANHSESDFLYDNNFENNEFSFKEDTSIFLKGLRTDRALSDDNYQETIAIIGGGFSGTLLATHLLSSDFDVPTRVILIDRSPRFSRGFAYSTSNRFHLLNVPAQNMSAFPNDPNHFLNWAQKRDQSITPRSFVPRMFYGEYLETILHRANLDKKPNIKFIRLNDEAIDIEDLKNNEGQILLESGKKFKANKIILATGNYFPKNPKIKNEEFYSSDFYVKDPWSSKALQNLNDTADLLFIGTGLTMVDKAIELKAKGHKGTIYALSRHGLLPSTHKLDLEPIEMSYFALIEKSKQSNFSIVDILHDIKTKIRHLDNPENWRQVIDKLRPHVQILWQSLTDRDKQRFLVRLRPLWDIHRHRMAPEISLMLQSMISESQLKIHAGKILEYKINEETKKVEISYLDRVSKEVKIITVSRVLNCSGLEFDFCQIEDPLLNKLLNDGTIKPDSLSLGFEASPEGALIDKNSKTSEVLFTLGPALKGKLWETTAVPEIRNQAYKLAELIKEKSFQKV